MRPLMFTTFEPVRVKRDGVWGDAPGAEWQPECESWRDLRWRLLCAPLLPPGADKLAVPCWSPAIYNGPRRSKAGAVSLDLLVLDYDDGTPIADARARWGRWCGLIHTSWGHAPEHPKYRVVLPLREPIEARVWSRAWTWAARWSGQTIDPKCKDPSRVYFTSVIPAEREAYYYATSWTGQWLRIPWESMPEAAPRPAKAWTPPPGGYKALELDGARREALRHPEKRMALAHAIGARLTGNRAAKVHCPGCGRRSVWWLIEPEKKFSAECDHKNSCGWFGSLMEVAHVAA